MKTAQSKSKKSALYRLNSFRVRVPMGRPKLTSVGNKKFNKSV